MGYDNLHKGVLLNRSLENLNQYGRHSARYAIQLAKLCAAGVTPINYGYVTNHNRATLTRCIFEGWTPHLPNEKKENKNANRGRWPCARAPTVLSSICGELSVTFSRTI